MKLAPTLALMLLAAGVVRADPITIVANNAKNLFDMVDDPENPQDNTYLPLAIKEQNRQVHDGRYGHYNGTSGFYVDQCKTSNGVHRCAPKAEASCGCAGGDVGPAAYGRHF